MKLTRTICGVVLVALCALGWISMLTGTASQRAQEEQYVAQGAEYAQRGLFEKAANAYRQALSLGGGWDVKEALLDTLRQASGEDSSFRSDYLAVLEEICDEAETGTEYWEELLEQLCAGQEYSDARAVLQKISAAKVSSATLEELADRVNYAYSESGRIYSQVLFAPDGTMTVRRGEEWGVLSADGESLYDTEYRYVSPYVAGECLLLQTQTKSRIADSAGVTQAYLSQEILQSRGCGSGKLPVQTEDGWHYFDVNRGAMEVACYEDASSFQNGVAYVKQNGAWNAIGVSGTVSEVKLEDIKLYDSGAYCHGGVMVAKRDGAYELYSTDLTPVSGVKAQNMDRSFGGWVAYQDANGLWGYIDQEGNVVIEPQYQEAKSFSGDLGAVFDGESWGFINTAQRFALPSQFALVSYFTNQGVCMVSRGEGFYTLRLRFA